MSNLDTIKAIEDNLSAIIAAQGFMLEDSSTDQALETKALCALRIRGEEFGDEYGQKPDYNRIRYALAISFNEKYPAATRDRIADLCHKIRNNASVNTLNAGSLAASMLVCKVEHTGYSVTAYNPPATELEYGLTITYRET